MGDLASRIEVTKLATELRAEESDLQFLVGRTPEELRRLRGHVAEALFTRHEDRVLRLASVSKLLPVPITAKIAELALGPMLSARVAGVLDGRDAAKLASHLDPKFLTEVSVSLDPKRVAPIVTALPDDLVVDVGRRLLAKGEHLALARFVSVVDVRLALAVVESGTAEDLLKVALYTDDTGSLDAIVKHVPDEMLADILRAADATHSWDAAVNLVTSLSHESLARIVHQIGVVEPESRNHLVTAVDENDVWEAVLPALTELDAPTAAALVNVPHTLDLGVIDRVLRLARDLDLAPVLVHLVLGMDDAHLDVVRRSELVQDPEVQTWLIENSGMARKLIEPVIESLSR